VGWGDFQCYNPASKIRAPSIQKLADEGMRFTHAHTPASFCSPTRYSMLTGNYAWRGRTPNGTWGFDVPGQILPGQKTVANLLKESGYRTAMFGKQGFGGAHAKKADGTADFTKPMIDGPKSWGFDYSAIIPRGHQAAPYFFLVDELPECGADKLVRGKAASLAVEGKGGTVPKALDYSEPGWDHSKVGERLLGHAEKFLDWHLAQKTPAPFYMHFCADGAHSPYAPPESLAGRRLRGETRMTAHTDMVLQTDILLGALMEMLEKRGLLNDTLICFTSDNGGIPLEKSFGHDAVGGLRGKKGHIFEGGHRVPFLLRWPWKIPSGKTSRQVIGTHDIVATTLELAGVPIPADQCLDSVSLVPVLLGRSDDSTPVRQYLVVDSGKGYDAMDDGDPKTLQGRKKGLPAVPKKLDYTPEERAMSSHGMAHAIYEGRWKLVFDISDQPAALYDLEADPAEKENLAGDVAHDGRMQRMTDAYRSLRASKRSTAVAAREAAGADVAWWHGMFSMSFDGHGNFVAPHLDTLHATAASLGAVGYHGPWEADLARDMSWMRGHEASFANHPETKRVVYIEGHSAKKVLARVSADGRVLFDARLLEDLSNPQRRRRVESLIKPGGRTVWISDWHFMQSPALKTSLGEPLPTAKDLGLPAFTHPLSGSVITNEAEFWRTRSASALIGERTEGSESGEGFVNGEKYAAIPGDLARALDVESITTQRPDGQWLVQSEARMLYDAPFARYQAAKGRRAMEVLLADMIHYDDWDLRSPTAMNARADIHVAAFREFVKRRFSAEHCREFGFEKSNAADFDVLGYLLNPPWRSEYKGAGDQPLWRAAADSRWLSDRVWRAFQIAAVEEKLASMKEVYRLNKQAAHELGRDVPMVANVIPMLSALFLQRDCVDMANFEWPVFKTFTAFVKPLGYYPQARLGIGPRMASKIGVTGHAIVDPYVEPQYSGWDGAGFTKRHGESLHKVIYFDLIANRGIPAFSLTFDGGFSPGSIHSAGNLHSFIHQIAPVISKREYLADIGVASSSWSQIAAQPPWAWNQAVTKRHASEFLGWTQYLASARDFPQWDVIPFDDVALKDLTRFKLVILPSVLVITADHLTVLEAYLKQGGKLLITGETGTFTGPKALLLPRDKDIITPLAERFPGQVTLIKTKPGLAYHENADDSAPLREVLAQASHHHPVLTATNAPEHIGIYANRSQTSPGELTIDLVNYHHDLPTDQITPVTRTDFTITLQEPRLRSTDRPVIESISYDEKAPNNTLRQRLEADHFSVSEDAITLRIPPFTHYQVLRISTAKGQDPPHEFLAPRCLQPHLDPPVGSRPKLLRGMPLPLGDVDGQFRFEQQPDLHGRLAAGDPERLPGEGLGMEVGGPGESVAGGLHAPEAREGEGLDPALGRVQRQRVPVPVVREQVVRV